MSAVTLNPQQYRPARTRIIAIGIVLWACLTLIPMLHLELWPNMPPVGVVCVGLPLSVLGLFMLLPVRLLALAAFPLSFLPLIVMFPELMGPHVYGPQAFLAVTLATILFVITCRSAAPSHAGTPKNTESREPSNAHHGIRLLGIHIITHLTIGISMLAALYFYRPFRLALRNAYPNHEEMALIGLGLLVFAVWVFLTLRQLTGRLGTILYDPKKHTLEWLRFSVECNAIDRVRTSLGWSVLIAALSLGVLAVLLSLGT